MLNYNKHWPTYQLNLHVSIIIRKETETIMNADFDTSCFVVSMIILVNTNNSRMCLCSFNEIIFWFINKTLPVIFSKHPMRTSQKYQTDSKS